MSWLFIGAFLNSAKWNQFCASMAEWVVLHANGRSFFAFSPKHKDLKKKNPAKIYFGNNRARYGIGTMRVIKEVAQVMELAEA